MLSEFRRKKLTQLFDKFFDSDGSGTVDKSDFVLAAERIAGHRGWRRGDARHKEASDGLLQIWDGLRRAADADGDGRVSGDEWVAMWEAYATSPASEQCWQEQYCRFIFKLEDASGDGAIDCEEFATVYSCFGVDKEEAVAAYQKMSRGKPSVSWPEFRELWKEYFASEDPDAPGNFIFGRSSF